MKIQIDTKEKTIKIEENVNLNEFFKAIKKLLPNEWQNYQLLTGSFIYWYEPIYVQPYINPIWPNPIITCESTVYNFDIQT